MALTTVNITGTFNFPDATWTANTQAEFIISGYDTDTEVVVPNVVRSTLGPSGELDVNLWGNDDGDRGTVYRVNIVLYSDAGLTRPLKRIDLGKIQINGDGPIDIATLLNGVITVPGVWYSLITEEEYNAAIAAAADAEAAQSAAEDAQSYAEEWAVNPEDDPVSVAAGGDGSTTFSAFHWAQKSEEFASAIDPSDYVTLDDFTAADRYIYSTGAATIAEGVITSQGRALLDDVNAAAQRVTLGVEIGVDVQAYDEDLTSLAGGEVSTGIIATSQDDGTQSSGTYTPSPAGGNFRHIINGGAFTLAAPSAAGDYTMLVQITNNASAGAITMSGFTVVDGDDFTTTDGDDFLLQITKHNGFIWASAKAMQ